MLVLSQGCKRLGLFSQRTMNLGMHQECGCECGMAVMRPCHTSKPRSNSVQLPSHHPAKPSDELQHVHAIVESASLCEMTPPHPERAESAEYRKVHHLLIVEKDSPCLICGVRNSTLHDPASNPYQATAIHLHHSPIEWSLAHCIDPMKLHNDYPQVYDQATLEAFIDSPANLLVLCSTHHIHPEHGIHHLLTQDFWIQKYLKTGYQIAATKADEAQVIAQDEQIIDTAK